MQNATKSLIAIGGAAALAACSPEPAGDQNITNDIDAAATGDIEAVPADETSVPAPPEPNDGNTIAAPSPEETGDGDDMVNIIDDTGNRSE